MIELFKQESTSISYILNQQKPLYPVLLLVTLLIHYSVSELAKTSTFIQ
jgi:hypothetical protein